MAWWEVLQELHTKVRYLMQTVEKPYLEVVPQFGWKIDGDIMQVTWYQYQYVYVNTICEH